MKKGGASMLQLKSADNLAEALKAMVNAAMLSTSDAGRLSALLQSSQESSRIEPASHRRPQKPLAETARFGAGSAKSPPVSGKSRVCLQG